MQAPNVTSFCNTIGAGSRVIEQLYANRKLVEYDTDEVLRLCSDSRIYDRLVGYEIIIAEGRGYQKNSLDPSLVDFLEQVFGASEIVEVGQIAEKVRELNEDIEYYLLEKMASRKDEYLNKIKSEIRGISLSSLRNANGVQQNIDNVYKTEHNIEIKLRKLKRFREKIDNLGKIVKDFHFNLLKKERTFEGFIFNESFSDTIDKARDCLQCTNSIIEKALITLNRYISSSAAQNESLRKIRWLIEHKNSGTLSTMANLRGVETQCNALPLFPRIFQRTKVSVSLLVNTDRGKSLVADVKKEHADRKRSVKLSSKPIEGADMVQRSVQVERIDPEAVYKQFRAVGRDLIGYFFQYRYPIHQSPNEIVQHAFDMIIAHDREIVFTQQQQTRRLDGLLEYTYPIINLKPTSYELH